MRSSKEVLSRRSVGRWVVQHQFETTSRLKSMLSTLVWQTNPALGESIKKAIADQLEAAKPFLVEVPKFNKWDDKEAVFSQGTVILVGGQEPTDDVEEQDSTSSSTQESFTGKRIQSASQSGLSRSDISPMHRFRSGLVEK